MELLRQESQWHFSSGQPMLSMLTVSGSMPGKKLFRSLGGISLFLEAAKAPRTLTPGSTLGARPLKAGCCSTHVFGAKSFLELAASNLCKTSCIMALQSQSLACLVDTSLPAPWFVSSARLTGLESVAFSSFSLKKTSSVASVEKHFCLLHGAGVGLL